MNTVSYFGNGTSKHMGPNDIILELEKNSKADSQEIDELRYPRNPFDSLNNVHFLNKKNTHRRGLADFLSLY